MQKIDLLAASRCNMFSHVLAKYQSTLLHFWERTAYRMTAVAESFKGYQYFEFNMLKVISVALLDLILFFIIFIIHRFHQIFNIPMSCVMLDYLDIMRSLFDLNRIAEILFMQYFH